MLNESFWCSKLLRYTDTHVHCLQKVKLRKRPRKRTYSKEKCVTAPCALWIWHIISGRCSTDRNSPNARISKITTWTWDTGEIIQVSACFRACCPGLMKIRIRSSLAARYFQMWQEITLVHKMWNSKVKWGVRGVF